MDNLTYNGPFFLVGKNTGSEKRPGLPQPRLELQKLVAIAHYHKVTNRNLPRYGHRLC